MAKDKAAVAIDPELEALYGSYGGKTAKEDLSKIAKTDYVKLNPGRNIVRILPGAKGSSGPFRTIWQHFLKSATGKLTVLNCPQKEHGTYCPVCDMAETLKHSPSKADQEAAKSLFAKQTIVCYAIHRNPGKDEKPIGTLRIPFGVYSKVLNMRNDPEVSEAFEENTGLEVDKEEGVDFTHPITGFDIIIEKSGTGMQTKYDAKPKITKLGKSPALDDMEALKEALRKRPDFEAMAKVLTETEMKATLDAFAAPAGEEQKALSDGSTQVDGSTVEGEMHTVSMTKDAEGNDIPF